MTAIAGLVRLDGQPASRAALERVQGVLAPYGPDASQSWLRESAGFVRTLLRITPEDSLDFQLPYDAASGTLVLFDGRLDNREELADDLGIGGAELATLADGMLTLRACLRWDDGTPSRLLGDFALACWQPSRRRLWLARDPMGARPLFWHRHSDFFAFSTMPKGLFALPQVPRELDEEALHDGMCLLPMTGPRSLFKDVWRIEPGQVLTLEQGRIAARRYHDFDTTRELRLSSDDDYLEGFRHELERAVARRLRSRGAVASHLSSGFDSATVTAIAARQLAERGGRLLAYTAVPREGYALPSPRGRYGDEGPGARAVAARFPNIEHVLIRSGAVSPLKGLMRAMERLDRGPANPCNQVWIDAIEADAVQRGARVLLTGQMGNMTISYSGEPYLSELLAHGAWGEWWRELRALKRHGSRRWRGLLGASLGPYLPSWLWRATLPLRENGVSAVTSYMAINEAFMARMDSPRRIRAAGWDTTCQPWGDGRKMRIAVLRRMDWGDSSAAANAAGLEMRDPTADLRLIEYCLSLPGHQYLRGGQTRWLLRRLMGGVLPPEILGAKERGLQAADWHEGVSADLAGLKAEWQRLSEHPTVGRYLDLPALRKILDDWPEEGWHDHRVIGTFRMKLLRGLAVGAFVRYVDDRNS
ncbi:Asparagine synthetase [glutamine-hydrolyzing] 3 [Pigmentiphaga humi]|uniref:asparagine synthase (glutamine-hydrolyzing) n=1 Tax=Pigmentiphaga humi TaxID=2478468 RepID=A0A3P4B7J5_9BURK|nr:asparagine synthetase B [Pigmentiphaga humi]VCU72253.1 Asparagine synthetase [glutamine-hydrolyzing] 3 [Pigmentiphaga humi]